MSQSNRRRAVALSTTVAWLITITTPAAATHDTLPCKVPDSLGNLFSFIDTVAHLAFVLGIAAASLGLITAAILYMTPSQENARKAKIVLKNTIIGTAILLSSKAILAFMISELGAPFCT